MITVDSVIRVPSRLLSALARKQIQKNLSYPNPEYLGAKRRGKQRPMKKVDGKWVQIPPRLEGWTEDRTELTVPRGAIELLKRSIHPWPGVRDLRMLHDRVAFKAGGWALRPYQQKACGAMVDRVQGVVVIPAGGGKTFTALAAVARIGQPTLILVHTLDLVDQWAEAIEEQLGIEVAQLSAKKPAMKPGQSLAIATVQSLARMEEEVLRSALSAFGCMILDEGHHAPATTFDRIIGQCPAKYRLALTATPERADGLTQKLTDTFGPVIHETDQRALLDQGYLVSARIHEIHTAFTFPYGGAADWQALADALAGNAARNKQILDLLAQLYNDPDRVILVLSGRVEDHLVPLYEAAAERGIQGELLVGKVKKDTRRLIRKSVRAGAVRVLFASTVADEGLNIPELNTLLLTFPAKSESRVEQRVGRVMRACPGKERGEVFDFVDSGVVHVGGDSKPLVRQYNQRKKAYHKLRAEIVKGEPVASRTQLTIDAGAPILKPPRLGPQVAGTTRFAVGMDPSFTHFGLVAIELSSWWPAGIQTIVTAKSDKKLGLRVSDDDTRRLELLLAGLHSFLTQYPPAVICCETPSSGAQSADALKGLAYAKALACAAKVFHEVPTVWLLPGEVKQRVGGSLLATKAHLADVVKAGASRTGRPWKEAQWDRTKARSEHQFDAAATVLAARDTDLFQMALK